MVSYNFKSEFVPKIVAGTKTFTLRRTGKRAHAKVGSPLHLWKDARTPAAALILGKPVPCVFRAEVYLSPRWTYFTVKVGQDDKQIRWDSDLCRQFARADGFDLLDEFQGFHNPINEHRIQVLQLVAWGPVPGFYEPKAL